MFISDCSTIAYLVNAQKHVVLLNKQKNRSQRFTIGLPTARKVSIVRIIEESYWRRDLSRS